jgi:hypothetical protein
VGGAGVGGDGGVGPGGVGAGAQSAKSATDPVFAPTWEIDLWYEQQPVEFHTAPMHPCEYLRW